MSLVTLLSRTMKLIVLRGCLAYLLQSQAIALSAFRGGDEVWLKNDGDAANVGCNQLRPWMNTHRSGFPYGERKIHAYFGFENEREKTRELLTFSFGNRNPWAKISATATWRRCKPPRVFHDSPGRHPSKFSIVVFRWLRSDAYFTSTEVTSILA
jgi:hypothetical protein